MNYDEAWEEHYAHLLITEATQIGQSVCTISHLSKAAIRNAQLNIELIRQLGESLRTTTTLKSLSFERNAGMDEECWRDLAMAIADNSTLETLYLKGKKTDEFGAKLIFSAMSKNRSIVTLTLSEMSLCELPFWRLLAENNTLRHLSLSGGGALNLRGQIKHVFENTALDELSFSEVQLSYDDLGSLRFNLSRFTKVQILKLERSHIEEISVLEHLSTMITQWNGMRVIELGHIVLSTEGMERLAEALKISESLECLSLSSCDVNSKCCAYLASALKTNFTLQELCLNSNSIGDEGLKLLSAGLENSRLRCLQISNCSIGDEGLEHLLKSLANNQDLSMVNVAYNLLGEKSVLLFAKFLTENTSIAYLNVTFSLVQDFNLQEQIFRSALIENLNLIDVQASIGWSLPIFSESFEGKRNHQEFVLQVKMALLVKVQSLKLFEPSLVKKIFELLPFNIRPYFAVL
eukprot:TRINITY_DN5650_c0_g2_i1.p1 TRINITY_DN5650_c0_g2~~TRINITY_DN5650_c0_g2_i1.p1  ORF type:complete len:463 (-),score=108.38 TRINITY_DN5650_c0_g2_i1:47-1435(-)